MPLRKYAMIVGLAVAGAASAQVVVDGSKDSVYTGATFQTNPTGFGDSNLGVADNANGSELDGLFYNFGASTLDLLFTGNLESNFNKLEIFLDTNGAGSGQNVLRGDNADVDFNGLNRMAGLTFDTGFAPDYYLTTSIGGTPTTMYVNYATLPTGGSGTGAYLGSTTQGANGVLTGGTNPDNLLASWNNSNTAGVSGTDVNDPSSVMTGIEFSIPLSMLGGIAPGSLVNVSAFVDGSGHDFVSNQVLAGLPSGTGNLGDPVGVNFNNLGGNQFAPVPEPASMLALALGIGGVLARRRRRSA